MPKKQRSAWYRNTAAEALLPTLRKYHPHLDGAVIVVLAGPLPDDVRGRARRPRDNEAGLLEALGAGSPTYVIETHADWWANATLPEREAFLDHEMSHLAGEKIDKEGNRTGKWLLRKHDLEVFHTELLRHGPWRPELRMFVQSAQAMEKA